MKVLVVEDSTTVIAYLRQVLTRHPSIQLLTPAQDGRTGVERALAERPDVILMDLNLPELDGVSAIREILQHAPIPIVVLSANLDTTRSFEALQAGAVELLPKPRGIGKEPLAKFERRLVRTLEIMKNARVVVRRSGSDSHRRDQLGIADVVLIGASTGGPDVLRQLFSCLEAPLSAPVVIVQHTYRGFDAGLARWLSAWASVSVAENGARLRPGEVVLCPADSHLVLPSKDVVTVLPQEPGDLNPSVDRLFHSGAEICGSRAIGILLTGMGRDGAAGLLHLKERGALTITQRGETCVVDGMPAAARALGASLRELDVKSIASLLGRTCGSKQP